MDESAVSESVGVILIVAITVILAAVVAAFALGMTGNIETSNNNIILTTQKINLTHVTIMYRGGSDHLRLSSLTIVWPTGTIETDFNPQTGKIYGPAFYSSESNHITVTGNFSNKQQVLLNTFL